jgi:hypothetical protein
MKLLALFVWKKVETKQPDHPLYLVTFSNTLMVMQTATGFESVVFLLDKLSDLSLRYVSLQYADSAIHSSTAGVAFYASTKACSNIVEYSCGHGRRIDRGGAQKCCFWHAQAADQLVYSG